MNYADKSVLIEGNTKDGLISYICYPVNQFLPNKWRIAINGVVFDSNQNISSTVVITCNFVTSQQRINGDIRSFEQPLTEFHLKTSPTSPRGIFRFCN